DAVPFLHGSTRFVAHHCDAYGLTGAPHRYVRSARVADTSERQTGRLLRSPADQPERRAGHGPPCTGCWRSGCTRTITKPATRPSSGLSLAPTTICATPRG